MIHKLFIFLFIFSVHAGAISQSDFTNLMVRMVDDKLFVLYEEKLGMAKFAEEYFDGKIDEAFLAVKQFKSSKLAGLNLIKLLKWEHIFYGSAIELRTIRRLLLRSKNYPHAEMLNLTGLNIFAKRYNNNLNLAILKAMGALSENELSMMVWGKGISKVKHFLDQKMINPKTGELNENKREKLANRNSIENTMAPAVVILKQNDRKIENTISQQNKEIQEKAVNDISNEDFKLILKNFFERYSGIEGQQDFADAYFYRNKYESYSKIKEILTEKKFIELKWISPESFHRVTELKRLYHDYLVDRSGVIKGEYVGMRGLVNLLKFVRLDESIKLENFLNEFKLAVPESVFHLFQWESIAFTGSVGDFLKFRNLVLNRFNLVKDNFKGNYGYILIAKETFNGSLEKTWDIFESVLSNEEFLELSWKRKFHGSVRRKHYLYQFLEKQNRTQMISFSNQFRGKEGLRKLVLLFIEENQNKRNIISSFDLGAIITQFKHFFTDSELKFLEWTELNESDFSNRDKLRVSDLHNFNYSRNRCIDIFSN